MDSQEQVDWIISIRKKLEEAQEYVARKPSENCCIYRMPHRIRDAQESKKIYEPQTISIGPYHIGSEQVRDMDLYKWVALNQILERTGQKLELYLETIKEVEEQARACYQQQVQLSSNKFVEMLVLDGCFILELFLCYPPEGKPGCNPVLYRKRVVEDIVLDMIMLENQIPLFIIDRLLKLMNPQQNDKASDLALKFFNTEWLTGIEMSEQEFNEIKDSLRKEECLHILDVFRRSLIHPRPQLGTINRHGFRWMVCDKLDPRCLIRWLHCLHDNKAPSSNSSQEQVVYRVSELRKGGVKFRKRNTSCFLDFSFKNGVLEIPPIWVHDSTMTVLLNVAAFEQCHLKISDSVIASYVSFMECLIKSPEDVGHLHHHEIILGDDDAQVVDLFKTISKGILVDAHNDHYAKLSREVNYYCKKRRNRWLASLIDKYFYNPWAIISLTAAIILLFLTAIQSFYAVYAYYRPNS